MKYYSHGDPLLEPSMRWALERQREWWARIAKSMNVQELHTCHGTLRFIPSRLGWDVVTEEN